MKQIDLAKKINVTRQTLKNWEKTIPELIKLINMGIAADREYLNFYELFPSSPNGFFMLHDFYIDFYMRFINYFRQNISNPRHVYNENNIDINSTFIYYSFENNINNLFDKKFRRDENIDDNLLSNFSRMEFQKPLCNIDIDLSSYILRNTLDDFETLIRDSMYQHKLNQDLFLYSMYFATTYLIYKLEPSLTFSEKSNKQKMIFDTIGIDTYKKNDSNEGQDQIFRKYLEYRDLYVKKNIDQIKDELILHATNDFYIPAYYEKYYNKEK